MVMVNKKAYNLVNSSNTMLSQNNNKKNKPSLLSFLIMCSLAVIFLVAAVSAASLTTINPGSVSAVNYTFAAAGSNTSTYFSLPNTANVTAGTANVTGYESSVLHEVNSVSLTGVTAITSNNDSYLWAIETSGADTVRRYQSNLKLDATIFTIPGTDVIYDPSGIVFNGTHFWIFGLGSGFGADDGSEVILYNSTGGKISSYNVSFDCTNGFVTGSALDASGDYIYVGCQTENKVHKLNITDMTSVSNFTVSSPTGMEIDGNNLLIKNTTTGVINQYNTTGSLLKTYTGVEYYGLAKNNEYFYTASLNANKISMWDGLPSSAYVDIQNDGGLEFNFSESCYQESANVSTSCGGLNTGAYSLVGVWTNGSNTIDGNFSTFGSAGAGSSYMYVNYTKPTSATSLSKWYVKDGYGSENLTLLDSCFSQSTIQLRAESKLWFADSYVNWYCYNGSWNLLREKGDGSRLIYEEAMYWDIPISEQIIPDFTSELNDYIDNTCATSTCEIPINVTSGSAGIIQLSAISIAYQNHPESVSASDNSSSASPTDVGDKTQFSVTFVDDDANQATAYICKSNAFAGGVCTGGQWCNSGQGASPRTCTYTSQAGDSTSNNYWAFVRDSTGLDAIDNDSGTFETNHRPNAHTLNVTPTTAYTNDTLTCNYSFNDTDSDSEGTSLYIWINDSGTMAGQTSSTLASANFAKNDNVSCGVKAQDAHSFYDDQYVNSSSININNLPPDVQEATSDDSSSASPTNVGSNVTFTINATEQDGDTYELYVCKNDTFSAGTCTGGEWCNSTDTASGVNASCTYTTLAGDSTTENWYSFVWDGTNYSSSTDSDFHVNHRPNASAVNISPSTAYTNNTLTCQYTFNDADSDSENTSLRVFTWYNDTANININSETLASGNFSKLENLTCSVLVYDIHGFNDSQYRNSSAVQIQNAVPIINSNATIPAAPQYYNTTYITANVTDLDNDISVVNFTITAPNGTVIINNINGTASGDIWNSSNFTIDQYGNNWTVNITTLDDEGSSDTEQWTFSVLLGTLTPTPSSKTYTQQAGETEAVNFSFSHNGSSYNLVDIGLNGNLSNTSRFTAVYQEDPFNVTVGNTKYVQINITSNNTLADATYTGNVTLNVSGGSVYQIPYTVSIATLSGEISLDPITKSLTMTAGGTDSWQIEVSNIGNRDLENCNFTATGDLTSFTTFGNSDFTVTNVTPVNVAVIHTTPSAGTKTGTLELLCDATAYGGQDQEVVTPVSVNVLAADGGGGGGGGGSAVDKKKCSINVPSEITITAVKPVEKISIKNKEEFSIAPIYEIRDQNGKESAKDALSIEVINSIITSGETGEILLKLDTNKIDANETSYAKIVISTAECKDVYTDVVVTYGARETIISYFDRLADGIAGLAPFLSEVAISYKGVDVLWVHILVGVALLLWFIVYATMRNMLYAVGGSAAITTILVVVLKYVL